MSSVFEKNFNFFYGIARARLGEHLFAQKISLRLGCGNLTAMRSRAIYHSIGVLPQNSLSAQVSHPVALAQTLVSIKRALTTSMEIRNS